jgi:hypothetical protein
MINKAISGKGVQAGKFSRVLLAGIFPAGQGSRGKLTPFLPARLSLCLM